MPSKSYACEDFMSSLALTLISFHANANNNPTHYQFWFSNFHSAITHATVTEIQTLMRVRETMVSSICLLEATTPIYILL
jgi:hypothetical protein